MMPNCCMARNRFARRKARHRLNCWRAVSGLGSRNVIRPRPYHVSGSTPDAP
jgi:hypothetical protein